MEIFAKGQLSYMILNCLLDRDFYGLDFISEIYKKSNGQIDLKKPSVYSNLTRMEKQGYVSSYTKASDFGPNRRYYSITEKGRQLYQQLKNDFQRNNIDVFAGFSQQDLETAPLPSNFNDDNSNINHQERIEENKEDTNDFFNFSSLNENKEEKLKEKEIKEDFTSTLFINNETVQVNNAEKEEDKILENNTYVNNNPNDNIEAKKDDGVFVDVEQVNQYNQRLYDITKDINKYKKRRSFAEDQIAMTVETPLQYSEERNKANIEAFKNSLMENKNKYYLNQRMEEEEFKKYSAINNREGLSNEKVAGNTYFKDKPIEEVIEDDGKFITNRLENDEIIKPKKIQPQRIKILQTDKEEPLPPPKRDTKIDPSHKEIISRLYANTKDNQEQNGRDDSLYDYQDLADFYKEQNIAFNEYKKTNFEVKHNTNKLYFIHSLIIFLLMSFVSAGTFVALYFTNLINTTFNFLYFVLPALQIITISIRLYNFKYHTSWIPKQMVSFWQILGYTLLILLAIVGANFIFGLNVNDFSLFATTLILPSVLTIVALPISYLIKKGLLVKYWR